MKITVTVQDIRDGIAGSCIRCPVALAIARAFEFVDVRVSSFGVDFYRTCQLLHMELPEAAELFIRRFDDGAAVQRFSFELPLSGEQVAALEAS